MKTKWTVYKGVCNKCNAEIKSVIKVKTLCTRCEEKMHPERFSSIPGI